MNEHNPKKEKVTRKKYNPQFKDQAIERAEKDGFPEAAEDLGIPVSQLNSLRSKKRQGGGQPLEQQKLQQAELARLKREVNRLELEVAFLKKVATYFTKESK